LNRAHATVSQPTHLVPLGYERFNTTLMAEIACKRVADRIVDAARLDLLLF